MADNGIRYHETVSRQAVANAITEERLGPGLNAGYRFMQQALRKRHGLLVNR